MQNHDSVDGIKELASKFQAFFLSRFSFGPPFFALDLMGLKARKKSIKMDKRFEIISFLKSHDLFSSMLLFHALSMKMVKSPNISGLK